MKIISSGILVFGIILIRKVAWKVISRKMQYAIWLFAALFFLIGPFVSVPSQISFENIASYVYANRVDSYKNGNVVNNDAIHFDTNIENNSNGSNTILPERSNDIVTDERTGLSEKGVGLNIDSEQQGRKTTLSFSNIWSIVRWGVTVILLIYIFILNARFYFYCKKNRSLYDKKSEGLQVYLLNGIISPFLLGKSIYVDIDMTEDRQILEHILLHETCHFKNGDMLWMVLRYLSICLNWYNPFVWIAARYVKMDCELACDESVIHIIGNDASVDYGKTLINLLKKQKKQKREITIATAMSDKKAALKERILKIKDVRRSNVLVAICIMAFMFVLTGCSFLEKTNNESVSNDINMVESSSEVTTDNKNVPSENTEKVSENNIDEGNSYYNSVKYDNEYLYFADGKTLSRRKVDNTANELGVTEELAQGSIKIGNISNGNIYYVKYPVEDNESGVYQLDCNLLTENKLLDWDDSMWLCSDLYVKEDALFLEMADKCIEYKLSGNSVQEMAQSDNCILNALLDCNIPLSSLNKLEQGYVSTYFAYGLLILFDEQSNQIQIYDVQNKQIKNTIAECTRDVIIAESGLVYKGLDDCIYVNNWEDNKSRLLYEPAKNNNQNLNYGTFDSKYLYAFVEKDTNVELIKISWQGEYQTCMVIENVKRAVDLGLSVNKGYLSFHQNGTLNFIKQ